jgi:hypothetical protein
MSAAAAVLGAVIVVGEITVGSVVIGRKRPI